jgi:hypothetical protein
VEIQTGEFERFLGCLGAKVRPLCGSFQLAQGKNESGIHLTLWAGCAFFPEPRSVRSRAVCGPRQGTETSSWSVWDSPIKTGSQSGLVGLAARDLGRCLASRQTDD